MIRMFTLQKRRNDSHSVGVCPPMALPSSVGHDGTMEVKKTCSACPPIQAWMPNHPQATMARMRAGRFEPNVPYAARAKTGKGMPYFVPGWELRRMGTSTMLLPRRMVISACHQFIPAPISADESMYVGMQCAMEMQSAAWL